MFAVENLRPGLKREEQEATKPIVVLVSLEGQVIRCFLFRVGCFSKSAASAPWFEYDNDRLGNSFWSSLQCVALALSVLPRLDTLIAPLMSCSFVFAAEQDDRSDERKFVRSFPIGMKVSLLAFIVLLSLFFAIATTSFQPPLPLPAARTALSMVSTSSSSSSSSSAQIEAQHLPLGAAPGQVPPPTSCLTWEDHELYLHRLGLDDAIVRPHAPCGAALMAITEAHVANIPFENLSQHGAVGGPQTLDIPTIVDKVLRRRRGGFCFELNALLAAWLEFLGYRVKRVPAIVYAGAEIGFRDAPTHLLLFVSGGVGADDDEWLVDVAFGEPAIHPLRHVMGLVQMTPEGMESRIKVLDQNGNDGNDDPYNIILEWNKPDMGGWIPRLKWKETDTVYGRPLVEFVPYLAMVLDENSVFAKKMLICKIDRTEKRTLSGTKYKITSPRFGAASQVSIHQLASDDEARRLLWTDFGIAMEETIDLSTAKSDRADPNLFSHM
jgi:arylamine N-acetyltransferase